MEESSGKSVLSMSLSVGSGWFIDRERVSEGGYRRAYVLACMHPVVLATQHVQLTVRARDLVTLGVLYTT